MADRADDVRPEELRPGKIGIEVRVHQVADGEEGKPGTDQDTAVDRAHETRHERDQRELWQADPGQNLAYLLGVVALHLREVERQDVGRAVEHRPQQPVRQRREAEIALEQKTQLEEWRLPRELDH